MSIPCSDFHGWSPSGLHRGWSLSPMTSRLVPVLTDVKVLTNIMACSCPERRQGPSFFCMTSLLVPLTYDLMSDSCPHCVSSLCLSFSPVPRTTGTLSLLMNLLKAFCRRKEGRGSQLFLVRIFLHHEVTIWEHDMFAHARIEFSEFSATLYAPKR
jgi:hypothetical protein